MSTNNIILDAFANKFHTLPQSSYRVQTGHLVGQCRCDIIMVIIIEHTTLYLTSLCVIFSVFDINLQYAMTDRQQISPGKIPSVSATIHYDLLANQ